MNIAIVGAGMAGCTLAQALSSRYEVTVFEKSRGAGGRTATRYVDHAGLRFEFDHGAPDFAAREPGFRAFLEDAAAAGAVARYDAPGSRTRAAAGFRFTGTPRMNSVCRWLVRGIELRTATRITAMRSDGRHWLLLDAEDRAYGPYDFVVLTAPAPQTAELAPADSPIATRAREVRMDPCLTLMLGFPGPLPVRGPLPERLAAPLDRMVINSAKPQRRSAAAIVAHASPQWSRQHLDTDPATAQEALVEACARSTGLDISEPCYASLHRWRYATTTAAASQDRPPFELDADYRLAACGDWLVDGRLEGAWTSARALAEALPATCPER